jgi:rod shape-determining protein MreC
MQELIRLVVRYSGLILFLILEGISFYLLIQFNERQNRLFKTSSSQLTGYLTGQFDGIATYFSLKAENQRLVEENTMLRNQKLLKEENEDCFFDYIPCRVIGNSIVFNDNYFLLNKGTRHGIENNSGVVDDDGIVGIIIEASENFSTGISLLHTQTKISGSIGQSGYFGTLIWDGKNPRRMLLEDVPTHATVEVGDTIFTSGYSIIFPQGLVIGIVDDIDKEGKDFYFQRIGVRLVNDLANAKNVYMVKNLEREEMEKMLINQQ